MYDARGDHKHNPKDNDKGRKGKAHITDEVLATASEGDCSDDPSDDHQSYLTLSTATPLLLHTETPSTSVRFLLDSGASNNITNNVTLARSFNFKKLKRPGKTFGGSVAGHQMTATLFGTLDWACTGYHILCTGLHCQPSRPRRISGTGVGNQIPRPRPDPYPSPTIGYPAHLQASTKQPIRTGRGHQHHTGRGHQHRDDGDDGDDGAPGAATLLPTPTARECCYHGRGGTQTRGQPLAEHVY